MSKKEKVIDISGRFTDEISAINNILNYLEQGLITELHPKANMYGSLATNITNLRKELNNLIQKIEYGKDSQIEEIGKIFFDNDEK